jgi:juvenile-hormone esterase
MDTGKVILVSVQYRLSVLGFLSTGDANASGNFGLKDQAMALQWTKKNIEYFGGDANRITVFGQSAGAASSHMHMISPLSRNLIDQAIVISGNAIAPYNELNPDPLGLARKHAQAVGIEGADKMTTESLAEALRKVDASDLVDATAKLKVSEVDLEASFLE